MAENKPTPVKHINAKVANINPRDVIKNSLKTLFMCRMYGVIMALKHFEDKKDGAIKTSFIGEFQAIGPDGTVYEADKMYAFKALEDKLAGAFNSGGEKAVEFCYDINAIPDEKSATGYVYTAKSVIATAQSDRLSALAGAIAQTPLPTAPAAPEGDKAPEPAPVAAMGKGKK
jgi:hypothetical protein